MNHVSAIIVSLICTLHTVGCVFEPDEQSPIQKMSDQASNDQDSALDTMDYPLEPLPSVTTAKRKRKKKKKKSKPTNKTATVATPTTWTEVSRTKQKLGTASWTRVKLKGRVKHGQGWVESTGEVLMFTPVNATQTVVGLAGWDIAARTWEDNAKISELALQYKVNIALPEMHKTIYESRFYKETDPAHRWSGKGQIGGGRWVGEVVLPYLQTSYGVVTGIFGLSTGARGAVLVPQLFPELRPLRICAMSGTYDLFSLEPTNAEYPVYASVYGDRDKYKIRWKDNDTMSLLPRLTGTQVLLIHGTEDLKVPASQSITLHEALQTKGWSSILEQVEGGGHDWPLWSLYVEDCFSYMTTGERLTQLVPDATLPPGELDDTLSGTTEGPVPPSDVGTVETLPGSQEIPEVPVTADEVPTETSDTPEESQVPPEKSLDAPVETPDAPGDTPDIPVETPVEEPEAPVEPE